MLNIKFFFLFPIMITFISCSDSLTDNKNNKSSIQESFCKSNHNDYYYNPEKWLSYEYKNIKQSCVRYSSIFNVSELKKKCPNIECIENPYDDDKKINYKLWLDWEKKEYKISCSRYNSFFSVNKIPEC